MKKSDWLAIIIFQVIAEMLFMWCIDISVSAMLNNGIITSGFITSSPMFMYHVCLYASVLNLAFMCFICIHHILKDEDTKVIIGVKGSGKTFLLFQK